MSKIFFSKLYDYKIESNCDFVHIRPNNIGFNFNEYYFPESAYIIDNTTFYIATLTSSIQQATKQTIDSELSNKLNEVNICNPLFGLNKKVNKVESIKSFLGFVNSLFIEFSFNIKMYKKSAKINKKKINKYYYHINFVNESNKFI